MNDDLSAREVAYIHVLQGLLSRSERRPHDEVVKDAMTLVDLLFNKIEVKRKKK